MGASFRGGALSLMEATELARQTRHACVPTADGPLLLAQPSCWLGLRSETTSMELQAFQATQVAPWLPGLGCDQGLKAYRWLVEAVPRAARGQGGGTTGTPAPGAACDLPACRGAGDRA